MEYRQLGRSGLRVSEVSLGSWLTLGSSVDREGTREIVQRAYELGVNFFDTADVYANGEAVGEITSGTLSPTLGRSIAMAFVDSRLAGQDHAAFEVDCGNKRVPARRMPLPFYKRPK